MRAQALSPFSGEFISPEREAAYRLARFGENLRHAKLLFALGAVLHALALVSDWRFHGQPFFYVAVPARCGIVLECLVCLALAYRVRSDRGLQNLLLGWEVVMALLLACITNSHSTTALLVVILAPAVFVLSVPTTFRKSILAGFGTSIVLLCGYLLPPPLPDVLIGLFMIVMIQNVACLLIVVRSNRLQRQAWLSVESERRAGADLDDSRQLFQTLFQAVPVPIIVSTFADGRIVRMNAAARSFFSVDQPDGECPFTTHQMIERDDRLRSRAILQTGSKLRDFEARVNGPKGQRHVSLSADHVVIGGVPSLISSVVDITDRRAAVLAIREVAHHDGLTGLANRILFQERIDADIADAAASGGCVGLILLDLDRFKEVNDTLGHAAGDALLREVGQRISAVVEPGELVARLGGDEFVVICAGTRTPEATRARVRFLAAEIVDRLVAPVTVSGRSIAPRASLGLALYPDHAANAADLFTNADLALYSAKGAGRNQIALFDEAMRARITERVLLARDMRIALSAGQIVPFYQPKVCLGSGRVVGFEALARWRHPERGILPPAAFAAAFDDPEIGALLGASMITQVARDVGAWLAAGLDPGQVFVNLSSAQFAEPQLADRLLAIFAEAGVPFDRFGVEVTETVLMGSRCDQISEVLERLRDAGLGVALDDFGTGYASLTHLKRFPVHEIKIDRSFVSSLTERADDAAIVTAVVLLGRSLGLAVTAEGVETAGHVAFLQAAGCSYAQGYHYAKPSAASDVPPMLMARAESAPRLVAAE